MLATLILPALARQSQVVTAVFLDFTALEAANKGLVAQALLAP